MDESAKVKFLGSLGRLESGEKISEEMVKAPSRLGDILQLLSKKYDLELNRDSMLVLVNGVEANALEDLETVVKNNDTVILVPMFHGG